MSAVFVLSQEYKKLEALLANPTGLSAEERKEKQEALNKAAGSMRRCVYADWRTAISFTVAWMLSWWQPMNQQGRVHQTQEH